MVFPSTFKDIKRRITRTKSPPTTAQRWSKKQQATTTQSSRRVEEGKASFGHPFTKHHPRKPQTMRTQTRQPPALERIVVGVRPPRVAVVTTTTRRKPMRRTSPPTTNMPDLPPNVIGDFLVEKENHLQQGTTIILNNRGTTILLLLLLHGGTMAGKMHQAASAAVHKTCPNNDRPSIEPLEDHPMNPFGWNNEKQAPLCPKMTIMWWSRLWYVGGSNCVDHTLCLSLLLHNDRHLTYTVPQQASTISMQDCILRRGFDFNMMDPVSLPVTPGHDFAGHVVARGNHVTDDRIPLGALVVGLVRTGGNGRFISVPVDSIIPVPRKIGPEEAVCMVSIYATALHCLKLGSRRHLLFSMDDQKVLVIGGMDGVGHALVDWCKRAKAEVYVTAPENRHLYIKTSLGAKPLPENPEEWPAELQGQMDMVFDGVGHTVSPAVLASLKPDHSLVCYGKSSLLKQRMGMFGAPLSAHLDRFQTMFSSNIKVVDLWKSYRSDPEAYKVCVLVCTVLKKHLENELLSY